MDRKDTDSKKINVIVISIILSRTNSNSIHTGEKKAKPYEGLLGDTYSVKCK